MDSKMESKWQRSETIISRVSLRIISKIAGRRQRSRWCRQRIRPAERKLLVKLRRVRAKWKRLNSILHTGIRAMDCRPAEVGIHIRELKRYGFQVKNANATTRIWTSLRHQGVQNIVDQEIQIIIGPGKLQKWKAPAQQNDLWAIEALEVVNRWLSWAKIKLRTGITVTKPRITCITVLWATKADNRDWAIAKAEEKGASSWTTGLTTGRHRRRTIS